MTVPTLYTPTDVAEALEVTAASITQWIRKHDDTPSPAFVRTTGAPLWDTLEAWIEWNTARVEVAEREAKARAEARLAKAKADYEAALAALEG